MKLSHSTARRLSISAWATTPYLVVNIGVILTTTGSIVHMSSLEWAVWTAVSSLALCLIGIVILLVSATVTRKNRWISTALSILVFAGLATAIEPNFWGRLLRPMENGIAYWLFVTGALAAILAFLFSDWRSSRDSSIA